MLGLGEALSDGADEALSDGADEALSDDADEALVVPHAAMLSPTSKMLTAKTTQDRALVTVTSLSVRVSGS